MERRLHILSDGIAMNTQVRDMDTGALLAVSSIVITIVPGKPVTATITSDFGAVDVIAQAETDGHEEELPGFKVRSLDALGHFTD